MLLSKEKNPKMEEVRKYIQTSSSADFNNLAPHILNAEHTFLIPLIGQLTYDQLQNHYNRQLADYTPPATPVPPSAWVTQCDIHTARLLELVQSAILHLAYYIGFDMLNSHITDNGFKRIESETVKSMFKYQETSLKSYFRTSGFNGLDAILTYMELNFDYFEKFRDSEQYTVAKSSFIPKTEDFNRIVFISSSRLTFLRMKPHMALVEETEILPIMGAISFSQLKEEMDSDTPSPQKMAILPYIQKAIAFLSSALLMEESGADLLDNGLYFDSIKATNTNDSEHKPSSDERIAILVKRNRNFGYAYLDQIRSFLVAHAEDWSDTELSTGKVFRRNNTDKKSFWP